ncbi:MAG TPA: flagellar biosynthetic protein FliO [Tepidisphaeraceae bacterium]
MPGATFFNWWGRHSCLPWPDQRQARIQPYFSSTAARIFLSLLFVCLLGTVLRADPLQPIGQQRLHRDSAVTPAGATQPSVTASKPTDAFSLRRLGVSLAIVIGLILALRYASKWFFTAPNAARSSRAIQVLSRSIIAPKQQLMLVQVGRRLLVVANSGAQINPLCEITDPEEVAQLIGQVRQEKSDSISKTFSALFGRAEQKFDETEKTAAAEMDAGDDAPEQTDPEVAATRQELSGLMTKVRGLAQQYRG